MEAMIDLLPLHQVQKVAAQSALLIYRTTDPSLRNIKGHLEILKTGELEELAYLPSDHMPTRLNLEQRFKVILQIESCGTWEAPNLKGAHSSGILMAPNLMRVLLALD